MKIKLRIQTKKKPFITQAFKSNRDAKGSLKKSVPIHFPKIKGCKTGRFRLDGQP